MADLYVAGRRERIPLGTDLPTARVELARLVAEREAGRLRPRHTPAFAEVAERWLAAKEADPEARPNSIHVYRSRVKHLVAWFGEQPVDGITEDDVREFTERQLEVRARATVGGLYAALRSVMRLAKDEGLINALPLPDRSPVGKVAERRDRLTLREAREVVDAMPEPWGSAARLALLTGLRVGEIQGLRAGDIDDDRGLLHVRRNRNRSGSVGPTKTERGERVVPLSSGALAVLVDRAAERPAGYLWPGSYRDAQDTLRATLKALDLWEPRRGWHLLRHAHAALLDAAGVSVRDAAARMGHGHNTAQTMAYGWAAEVGDAGAVDEALRRHAAPPGR